MKNEFANRQNMHLAVVALLADPAHQPAWKEQPPVAFTGRAAELVPLVGSLTDLIAAQQAATTGHAADKEREEQELEDAAHEISEALADWFEEQGREADAAKVSLSLSGWQLLRDVELIARAKLLHQSLVAALGENAASLGDHGLTAADATLLAKETADFETIVAQPAAAISGRKALTAALRPKFREVGKLLARMDRLILRFRRTAAGARFAETWAAARRIRDLGGAAAGGVEPAPPAP
jgi:hypothetical protein